MFRADAAFAKLEIYEALEARGVKYAIRIPANENLERDIAELLTRPVGRPSHKRVVWYKGFLYQAASWKTARRVAAKVEFHFGELFPRVGFIVTNLETDSRAMVRFYNKRGTAEQWIKEGKQTVKMTRLSCHQSRSNEVRPMGERDRLQSGEPVASAGAAEEDREAVADQFAATAGEDGGRLSTPSTTGCCWPRAISHGGCSGAWSSDRCAGGGDPVEGGYDTAKSRQTRDGVGEVFFEMAEKKQLPDSWFFQRGGIGPKDGSRREKALRTRTSEDQKLAACDKILRNRSQNGNSGYLLSWETSNVLSPTRGKEFMKQFTQLTLLALLALAPVAHAQNVPAPAYKVDPFWPKMPLKNKWIIQGVPTMVIDKDEHIWVLNRPRDINPDESGAATNPARTDCCIAAPAVLEFDTEGNLLNAWGGPDYTDGWPAKGIARPGAAAEHNIIVDRDGNVWISGSSQGDSIQKFTADGKLLWDFGHRAPRPPAPRPQENNQQVDIFPGGIFFFDLDESAREIYIVDAKRVLVYDYDGKFKRGWGGHGIPLNEIDNNPTPPYDTAGDPPDQKQFAPALHCVHFSVDGLVYVCERGSDRVQVFTKEGKFVSSFFVHPSTPSRGKECGGPGSSMFGMCGTIYNLTFSHDPQEKYVLIADGTNDKIWIHDRMSGKVVGEIGDNGRMAGMFHWIDAVAIDSKGNLYTGEVDTGKRVQKFNLMNGDGVARPRPHE